MGAGGCPVHDLAASASGVATATPTTALIVPARPRGRWRLAVRPLHVVAVAVGLGLIASVVVTSAGLSSERGRVRTLSTAQTRLTGELAKTRQSLADVSTQLTVINQHLSALDAKQARNVDTTEVARAVLKSVFAVEMTGDTGSAFALQRDGAGGTLLVTNFHVVADDFNAGITTALIHRGDETYTGKIV